VKDVLLQQTLRQHWFVLCRCGCIWSCNCTCSIQTKTAFKTRTVYATSLVCFVLHMWECKHLADMSSHDLFFLRLF